MTKAKADAPKTKHLKNPAQACELMLSNLQCFQDALEANNKNQFRLVNVNLNNFREVANDVFDKLQSKQDALYKLVMNLIEQFKSFIRFREK